MTSSQLLVFGGVAMMLAIGYMTYLFLVSAKKNSLNQLRLPVIRPYTGCLSSARNTFFAFWDINGMILLGYENYFKKHQTPFILPALQNHIVLLPHPSINWLTSQPSHILSAPEMQKNILQTNYTFLDPTLQDHPVHLSVIKKDLTGRIDSLIPDMEDELSVAIDEYWGVDCDDWKEVGVFDSMMKIISRTSNRVFVGLPLCRNETYLGAAASFAQDIALSAGLLRLLPNFLKPLLAPLITIPNKYHFNLAAKYLIPLIKTHISSHQTHQPHNLESAHHGTVPTWFLREALTPHAHTNHPSERTPLKLALRTMSLNFASIHTTTFTVVNLLFDLFCSPSTTLSLPILRQEIESIYAANGYKWDKTSLSKLVKTDSALRESMRISTFLTHGLNRLVVAKDGVVMPDGLYLPHGTKVGTSSFAIHRDEDVYPQADTYIPFRFSPITNSEDDSPNPQINQTTPPHTPSTTPSPTHLPFGAGKHACPGRFFATTEIKMIVAYIIMNYDIQPRMERPKNTCIGQTMVPPLRERLAVRRRQMEH